MLPHGRPHSWYVLKFGSSHSDDDTQRLCPMEPGGPWPPPPCPPSARWSDEAQGDLGGRPRQALLADGGPQRPHLLVKMRDLHAQDGDHGRRHCHHRRPDGCLPAPGGSRPDETGKAPWEVRRTTSTTAPGGGISPTRRTRSSPTGLPGPLSSSSRTSPPPRGELALRPGSAGNRPGRDSISRSSSGSVAWRAYAPSSSSISSWIIGPSP